MSPALVLEFTGMVKGYRKAGSRFGKALSLGRP